MKSTRLRFLGTCFFAGAVLLLLALLWGTQLSPRSGVIQSCDASVKPRFVKLTRGVPEVRRGRNSDGRSIRMTNYIHTIYNDQGLGLSSRFRFLWSQRLWNWSLKLGLGLRPTGSQSLNTAGDISALWIGYQAPPGLYTNDCALVDEQGKKIPLTCKCYLSNTNQCYITTWTLPLLLTQGGRFEFVAGPTGEKMFLMTLPSQE